MITSQSFLKVLELVEASVLGSWRNTLLHLTSLYRSEKYARILSPQMSCSSEVDVNRRQLSAGV